MLPGEPMPMPAISVSGRLDGGADSLGEHLDDLVELQVVEVLLELSVDRSVVRNDPRRNV